VKYSIVTFGCRVNQADSLGFEEELLALGASAASLDEADLVFVNTCSVTASEDCAFEPERANCRDRLLRHAAAGRRGELAERRSGDSQRWQSASRR
jgi:hypothetical protein